MATFVRVQEVEHPIAAGGQFTLRTTSADVEMRGRDTDVARVRIEFELRAGSDAEADQAFEGLRYGVHTADGVLEVTEPRPTDHALGAITRMLGITGIKVETRVVAEVPERATITYSGVSADLIATGTLGTQEYRTVSGDVVLSDAGGEIQIGGVSGDVSLRADSPVWLRANTVSGDLSAIAPRFEGCRVVTVSGDVDLDGGLAPGGEHRIETVSGDLSLGIAGGLTLEVRGLSSDVEVNLAHRSEGSRDRRRYVVGDGAASLRFSSMSGDVTVSNARRGGGSVPPVPPRPPAPVAPPPPPRTALSEGAQLEVLRALERGEIDVEEATRRLAGGGTDG
jgi:hypothetical protein